MSALMDQHVAWRERQGRLRGLPAMKALARTTPIMASQTRPGANLPRTGTAEFRQTTRHAVELEYAIALVEEATDVPRSLIMSSGYSAAIAARHLLWTILVDGGHSYTGIARIFNMDNSSVALGVKAFRAFQEEKARANEIR